MTIANKAVSVLTHLTGKGRLVLAGAVLVLAFASCEMEMMATGCTDEAATTGITGGCADDTLTGTDAAETLTGQAGNDSLNGAGGNDTLLGGSGSDTSLYAASTTAFAISFDNGSYTINGGTANGTDTLTGIETIRLSDEADRVNADITGVTIDGGAGTDTIALANGGIIFDLSQVAHYKNFEVVAGGDGEDTIIGTSGNDTFAEIGDGDIIDGLGGYDIADFSTATSSLSINLSDTDEEIPTGVGSNVFTVPANSHLLADGTLFTLRNIEHIISPATPNGGAQAYVFIGDDGDNVFEGGRGSDRFVSNGGNDVFVVSVQVNGVTDYFHDFGTGDKLDFRKHFPTNVITDFKYRLSAGDHLVIQLPERSGFVELLNVFTTDGLWGDDYADSAAVRADFIDPTTGVDISDILIFAGDN